MRRRDLLGTLGAAALGGLAGCAGLQTRSVSGEPTLTGEKPDGVYLPTHVEGMRVVGSQSSGDYTCALTYTYPHRFWLMKPSGVTEVSVESSDTVHLMPAVWETETGIVPPDLNPQIAVTQGGESVATLSPWPMLSQPMGFHFGDNVGLVGDGDYRAEVSVGTPTTRRTGSLADNEGGVSFAFEFEFLEANLEGVTWRDIPAEEEGTPGAVDPMSMGPMPSTQAPAEEDLPGTVRGRTTSDDAVFVVTTLDDATPFGGGEDDTYLAVSPRTPYNRYVLPLMALSATLTRDGETVSDGVLRSTLDPALRTHYGAVVPGVQSGDELTIGVDSPPQVSRHEGYETAFRQMGATALTLD